MLIFIKPHLSTLWDVDKTSQKLAHIDNLITILSDFLKQVSLVPLFGGPPLKGALSVFSLSVICLQNIFHCLVDYIITDYVF